MLLMHRFLKFPSLPVYNISKKYKLRGISEESAKKFQLSELLHSGVEWNPTAHNWLNALQTAYWLQVTFIQKSYLSITVATAMVLIANNSIVCPLFHSYSSLYGERFSSHLFVFTRFQFMIWEQLGKSSNPCTPSGRTAHIPGFHYGSVHLTSQWWFLSYT